MYDRFYMKRCQDSGLWVAGAGGSTSVGVEGEDDTDESDDGGVDTRTRAVSPPSPPSASAAENDES